MGRSVPWNEANRSVTQEPIECTVTVILCHRNSVTVIPCHRNSQEGDLLVELDPTAPRADRDRLARELLEDRLTAARLSALGDAMGTGTAPALGPLPGIAEVDVARHRRLLEAQLAEYRDRLAAQANAVDSRRAA